MSRAAIIDNSTELASWRNREYQSDLYYYGVSLYRHRDGKYFLCDHGGGAMRTSGVRWIDETQALEFIETHASHPVSGYGFTHDEAVAVLAGQDVRGTRGFEGGRLPAPNIASFGLGEPAHGMGGRPTAPRTHLAAVECVCNLDDGRRLTKVLLVPVWDDPRGGTSAMMIDAERVAASKLRARGSVVGTIYTHAHLIVPLDTLTPENSPCEMTLDERPAFGPQTPYTEHTPEAR